MIAQLSIKDVLATARYWLFFQRSQRWNEQQIGAYQDEKLKCLIRHAGQHVPYYRDLFDQIGLDPDTFSGRADMSRIPLLDKETVRTNADALVADNADTFRPKWTQTSGSTGTPLKLCDDASSRTADAAATLRAYGWAGYLPGMKVFTIRGHLSEWTYKYSMLGRSLDFDTVQLTKDTATAAWNELNKFKPSFFHGYPFSMLMLGQIAHDLKIPHHCPSRLITFGESVPDNIREKMTEVYDGAELFDFYGMTEKIVMITECEEHTRHAMGDYAYHEFLDDDEQPVDEGKAEIIGTSLYNYAMPLIRYRTRDYAKVCPPTMTCKCGRHGRIVKMIEGRKEDFIQTPDGRIVNLVEGATWAGKGVVASQYIQDEPDHLTVNLLTAPDYDRACLPEIEKGLRLRLGNAIRVDFKIVDELERRPGETGKVPFIISKVGNTLYTGTEFE